MRIALLLVFFLVSSCNPHATSTRRPQLDSNSQSRSRVKIVLPDLDGSGGISSSNPWTSRGANAWPTGTGIKLVNSANVSFGSALPAQSSQFQQRFASSSSPSSFSSSSSSSSAFASSSSSSRTVRIYPPRRTFVWQTEELLISCNMTALANPTCTRLVPPLTWMSASGAKIKVLHTGLPKSSFFSKLNAQTSFWNDGELGKVNDEAASSGGINDMAEALVAAKQSSSIIEIAVGRSLAESSLSALRMHGFKREDIYRMLDKGPWVLAFDLTKTLPKLFTDLQVDLGLNQVQAVHVISHCPYLIAQYARYKGRDVYTTAKALVDVGYTSKTLIADIMRFPSMLSAPPDRLRGWMALLEGYGVAREPSLFGKLLKRAPFMFYINPPLIWEQDAVSPEMFSNSNSNINIASNNDNNDVSTTASGFVVNEALCVLNLLRKLSLPDMDKIVRTQPAILLASAIEVSRRVNFLLNLFLDRKYFASSMIDQNGLVVSVTSSSSSGGSSNNISSSGSSSSSSVQTVMPFEAQVDDNALHEARKRAHESLGALLLTYPAVLSIDHEQMRLAGNALRAAGLRRADVVLLAKRFPPVLGRSPEELQALVVFLKVYCGLRKVDLVPFLVRYPAALGENVSDLRPKVDYLYQSLNGSPSMLRRFPSYLSFDLDTFVRPRAEFLRALNLDPLFNGLPFLLNSPADELSYAAGMQPEVFTQFRKAYAEMWRKKKQKEKESGESSVLKELVDHKPPTIWEDDPIDEDTNNGNQDDIGLLLDELDDVDF